MSFFACKFNYQSLFENQRSSYSSTYLLVEVCSACKPGWYLYGTTCDTCGDNCVAPANSSAR